MNDVRIEELVRLSMQRELTPEEESHLEAYLSTHAQVRADWETERAVSRALLSLPDVPVSSNFTARVLQAVELEERQTTRNGSSRFSWRQLVPRLAFGGAAAALVVAAGMQYQVSRQAQAMQALNEVNVEIAKLPDPELLQDFDAIYELRQVAFTSDDELLQVFQ